ncbi:hypothetical protein Leryth_019304 [Lithospermum erythrorhizon]|nr:hypothetical protein Leryth_019304 [Lithospermum erythrorhizon]
MYRGFPYSGEKQSSEALIDSIKLQRERGLAKAETKKYMKKIHIRISTGTKSRPLQKLLQSENVEHLERSSLTEEHVRPVDEPKPSSSSDSTQNSSQRKREASSPAVVRREENSSRSNGKVIRIRLPSQKRTLVSSQEPRSTISGGTKLPLQKQNGVISRQEHCSTSEKTLPSSQKQTLVHGREHCPTTFARTKLPLQKQNTTISSQGLCPTSGRKMSLQKETLVSRQEPCSTISGKMELPLRKQNAIINRHEICSTSGRTESATSNKRQRQVDVSFIQQLNNNVAWVRPPRPETDSACSALAPKLVTRKDKAVIVGQLPEDELPKPTPVTEGPSTLGGSKAITCEDCIAVRDPKLLDKKLVKVELQYRDLFVNWVPPPIQMELDSDDQDWLYCKKKPDNQSEKKLKPSSNNVSCSSSSSLWPRALFIPEADIYALPFTVPF